MVSNSTTVRAISTSICPTIVGLVSIGTSETKEARKNDGPVLMLYNQLLPHFLNSSLVQLRELRSPPTPLPRGNNANARCEFHSGEPRHIIENCKA